MKKLLIILSMFSSFSFSTIDLNIQGYTFNENKNAQDINNIIKNKDLGVITIVGEVPTESELTSAILKKNPTFNVKYVSYSEIKANSAKVTGDGINVTGSMTVYYYLQINTADLIKMNLSNLKIGKWDDNRLENNNITINNNQLIFGNTSTGYFAVLFRLIDMKYYNEERVLIPKGKAGSGSILNDYLDLLTLNTDYSIKIINSTAGSETDFKSGIFNQMTVKENNIYSYNLRITNLHNNTYFDFSVNLCNLNTAKPVKIWDNDLHTKAEDVHGKKVAIDKTTKQLNYQTESNCGDSGSEHWLNVNVSLPFSDFCPEIHNIETLKFFTLNNDSFQFTSRFYIKEFTYNYGTKEQISNSNDKMRQIDISKDNSGNDFNVFSSDKQSKVYANQHAYGNNHDGVVSTEGGDAGDTHFHNNIMHARGYEDIFYGNDNLFLHTEGLTKTDRKDYGATYDFSFWYGQVEFYVNWDSSAFDNLSKIIKI